MAVSLTYPKDDSYFLSAKKPELLQFTLENVPVGDYKKIKFRYWGDQQTLPAGRNCTAKLLGPGSRQKYDLDLVYRDGNRPVLSAMNSPSAFSHQWARFQAMALDNLRNQEWLRLYRNMAFQSEYFYEWGSNSLEMLVDEDPYNNPVEMG
ncbi:hypothetical protein FQR65_LT19553 [Abscondita terminalis]|nr:hypothetical protein FQR65_LT19553 [Abscondita terminalis]